MVGGREIKEAVRRFVVDNFILATDAGRLSDDASFLEGGILDSTGFLELVGFLEETWAIHVADEEMVPENLDSLEAIAAYVGRKLP